VCSSDLKAAAVGFVGSAIGHTGDGYARALVAGDDFMGFSVSNGFDNTNGANGAFSIGVLTSGMLHAVPVVGVTGAGNTDVAVYMSDDGTFDLDDDGGSNTAIGRIAAHVTGTQADIAFEALFHRSI